MAESHFSRKSIPQEPWRNHSNILNSQNLLFPWKTQPGSASRASHSLESSTKVEKIPVFRSILQSHMENLSHGSSIQLAAPPHPIPAWKIPLREEQPPPLQGRSSHSSGFSGCSLIGSRSWIEEALLEPGGISQEILESPGAGIRDKSIPWLFQGSPSPLGAKEEEIPWN